MKIEVATEPTLIAIVHTVAIWGITKIALKASEDKPWIAATALLLIGGLAFSGGRSATSGEARPRHGGSGTSGGRGSSRGGRRAGPP